MTRATFFAFVRLSRLKFLAGGFLGGALGTAVAARADGRVDWVAYALAQAAITAFHLMTHYANDYFDRAGDVRARRTPFSGGSGALVDGSLPAHTALVAALACAAAGAVAVASLAGTGRPLAAGVAVAIAVLAWSYSAPPLRLLARGLGEADTALVVAVLVPLCAYAAQRNAFDATAVAVTLPGAAAMLAMMLCVELPDRAADAASAKRTLVVRVGVDRARRWAQALVSGAWPAAVAVAVGSGAPPAFAILQACAIGPAVGLARAMGRYGFGVDDEEIAGRGVAFFFLVSYDALLGYLAR